MDTELKFVVIEAGNLMADESETQNLHPSHGIKASARLDHLVINHHFL